MKLKLWVQVFLGFLVGFSFSSRSLAGTRVAVTFDDLPAAGPEHPSVSRAQVAEQILKVLAKHSIRSVYGFANGVLVKGMQDRLEILKRWKAAGHLLGNHTFSHLDLGQVRAEDFIRDIERNESILIDYASKISELKWLRYPFLVEGESNEKRYAIRSYLAKRDYKVAPVTVDFEDWRWNEAFIRCHQDKKHLEELKASYLKHGQERLDFSNHLAHRIYGSQKDYGHILLLHFSAATAENLDELLSSYEKKGVRWISFSEAMKESGNLEDTTYLGSEGKTQLLKGANTRKISLTGLVVPQTPKVWLEGLCR